MLLTEALQDALARVPEARLAVLFGSTSEGRARTHSDIDVGVVLVPDTPDVRDRVREELMAVAGKWVDLVTLQHASPLLRMEVARHGTVLAERDPGAWSSFKARAMVDWWDWAPFARRLTEAAIRRNRERLSNGQA